VRGRGMEGVVEKWDISELHDRYFSAIIVGCSNNAG
jgi:hypothetical protein